MPAAPARLIGAALLIALATLLPGAAQAQHLPDDEDLAHMLRFLVEDRETVGIVLGVLDEDGAARILHHGSPGPDARPLAPGSVFDIGSITKTFTATVLADMVARGEVGLDDPVACHLPAHVIVPALDGREITLRDLAIHRSGLPGLPHDFRPADRQDPYADYTVERMYAFLSSHELDRAPGEAYEYSNLGYGLLGHALARAAGTSFPELVRARILEPLGMTRTGYSLAGHGIEGAAGEWSVRGHRFGGAVPHWTVTEAIAGAGGLHSSAEDMLAFLRANVGSPTTGLERAMRTAQAIQVPGEEEGTGQGLAWRTVRSPDGAPIVTHGGASAGFRANISFLPEQGIGTVVLANEGRFGDALGTALLRYGPPAADRAAAPVPSEVLARYAGEYDEVEGHGRFYVHLEEDGFLTYQPGGQVRARLYATSDTTFHLLRSPLSVTFREGEDGEGVEMRVEVDERDPGRTGARRSARRSGPVNHRRRRSPALHTHSEPRR